MTLLLVLIGVVPILVGGAGVASFLLLRAGYGFLVWGVLPFLTLLLVAGTFGLVLGRAARVTPSEKGRGGSDGGPPGGREGGGDEV